MVAPRTRYALGLPGRAPRGRQWAVLGTRPGSETGVPRYDQIKIDHARSPAQMHDSHLSVK